MANLIVDAALHYVFLVRPHDYLADLTVKWLRPQVRRVQGITAVFNRN